MESVSTSQSHQISVCVLDTNVWFKERLLLSSMGNAFLRSVNQQRAKIGFPQVVEMELMQLVKEEGKRLTKDWSDTARAVGHFTGIKRWDSAPPVEDFEKGLQNRLDRLNPLLERIVFSHSHAQSALKRLILGIAPSLPSSDAFRDCAIWEAALELSSSYIAHLITQDKGFYQGRDIKKGLAHDLVAECKEVGAMVQIHESIESYLQTFPAPVVTIPLADIEAMIEKAIREAVATDKQYTLGARLKTDLHHFLTEKPKLFAIQFRQEFEIPGGIVENNASYENASVDVSGNCTYNAGSKNISDESKNFSYSFYVGGETRRLLKSIRTFSPEFLLSTLGK